VPRPVQASAVGVIDDVLRSRVDGVVAFVEDRAMHTATVEQRSLGLPITAPIGPQSKKTPHVYRPAASTAIAGA